MIQFQLRLPKPLLGEEPRTPKGEGTARGSDGAWNTAQRSSRLYRPEPRSRTRTAATQSRRGSHPGRPKLLLPAGAVRPPLCIQAHSGRRATGRGPGPGWPCGSPRGGGDPLQQILCARPAGWLRGRGPPLFPTVPHATPRSRDRAALRPRRDPGCARSAYLARQSGALAAARAGRWRGGRCPGRAGRAAAESAPRRRGRDPASRREGALSGAAAVLAF